MSPSDPTESPVEPDGNPYATPAAETVFDSVDQPAALEAIPVAQAVGGIRPRVWTALAVPAMALVLCVFVSTVMIFVAMVLVLGESDPRALAKPATLVSIMESRLGFCLVVIPPQLMLLISSVLAAQFSPVEIRQRLSLVRGNWPVWTWLAVAAAAPLVGLVSSLILGQFMIESDSLKMMSDVFRDHCDSGFLLPLALIIGVTPAVCEELLFRGYVQTRLIRSFNPVIGVTIASVMFAAFHMDFVHSVAVLPLGFFLGFVVARSGSLFPAMLAHFVNNAISVVGVAFAPTGETDVLALPAVMISLSILGAGMIGGALVVFAAIYYRPQTSVAIGGTNADAAHFSLPAENA
ncbi:CPBP family intramembrane glutamic endopeptidase [Planctomycetes bacterium K23_9]|uniref:CAAX amino terminal protease self-immunity n=1 Tax=Stieleria marina TaxID=1930275 RepID=A0A517NU27_9BACT|nr:CAAX amino terminal protease self- immunity [Planctomycetes bacterium K23_9]